ncbi:MAG: hypothetical protein NXI12_10445 [Alphaproteobacteria bacterium]|nr:hypothetical protein [Alphaproteobacteria bacterium]
MLRSIIFVFAAFFMITAAAWAVYGQRAVLVGEGAEEVPVQSISFRLPDGSEVPAEEDEDDDGALIFMLPGDRGSRGEIVIRSPGGADIVIPAAAAGPGETLVIDLDRGTAYPSRNPPGRTPDIALPGPIFGINLDYLTLDLPDFGAGTVLTGPPGDPGTDEVPLVEGGDRVELSGVSFSGAFNSPFGFADYAFFDIAVANGDAGDVGAVSPTAMTYTAITYQDRPFDGGPTGVFLGDTGLEAALEREVDLFNAKFGFACDYPLGERTRLRPTVFFGYTRVEQSVRTELQSPTFADIFQNTTASLEQDFYSVGFGGVLEHDINPWVAIYGGLFGIAGLQNTDFTSVQENVCGACGPDNNFTSTISQSDDGGTWGFKGKVGARFRLTDRLALDVSGHATQASDLGGFFNPTSGDDLFVDDRPAQIANDDGVVGGLRLGLNARF